jgi:hypothetical protein
LARLGFKVDTSKSARINAVRARRFLQKEAGDARGIEERRSKEREALRAEAAKELTDADSLEGAAHLESLAAPIAERFGLSTEDLIAAARKEASAVKAAKDSRGWFSVEQIRRQRELDEQPAPLQAGAQELGRQIIIHMENSRISGRDGDGFQQRIRNAETRGRDMERWGGAGGTW